MLVVYSLCPLLMVLMITEHEMIFNISLHVMASDWERGNMYQEVRINYTEERHLTVM